MKDLPDLIPHYTKVVIKPTWSTSKSIFRPPSHIPGNHHHHLHCGEGYRPEVVWPPETADSDQPDTFVFMEN
ncbi:hypothetical protein KSP39_PZI016226 [Platanthera zijinensis]|uniref:Uncharacterized protein n=1 Tax=Platanthera zijinensis TaxID=2320716 RepID=A0AAP0G1D7_9ASPA